jgi:hypothetical protein
MDAPIVKKRERLRQGDERRHDLHGLETVQDRGPRLGERHDEPAWSFLRIARQFLLDQRNHSRDVSGHPQRCDFRGQPIVRGLAEPSQNFQGSIGLVGA